MHRKLLTAVALVAGPLLSASGAQAAQITFGNSAQNITFTGNGAGALSISSPTLTGSAFYDADPLGTYSIIPTIYLWREVSKPLAVRAWRRRSGRSSKRKNPSG